MLLHSLFELLLGVSNIDLAAVDALDLVDYNRLTANVVASTLAVVITGSAIAFESHEVFRFNSNRELPRHVALEYLPQVRKSVVGH